MLSGLIVPGCLLATLLAAACRRLPAYDLFVEGAREGIAVAVRVLPNLAAMLVAIGLMQASGLMDALCRLAARRLSGWACRARWRRWCCFGP